MREAAMAVLGVGAVVGCCALVPALIAGVGGVGLIALAGAGGAVVFALAALGALALHRRSNTRRCRT